MNRLGRRPPFKRKLPAGIQARLAGVALRAARTAAENGRCGVAEALFALGNVDLRGAVARARSKGAVFKTLDAGMEGADTAKVIIECRQRERAASSPSGATT